MGRIYIGLEILYSRKHPEVLVTQSGHLPLLLIWHVIGLDVIVNDE